MAKQSVILIIAGGTGGHIVPGLGLALEFAGAGDTVQFLSLNKNRGYADFASVPFPVHFYDAPPISKRLLALLAFPFRFMRALWRAWSLLREQRIDCVIGMGGYSIFPGIVAARLSGIPYYLCEQNAIPGRATRLFAGGARSIFLNFPLATAHQTSAFAAGRALIAGNPLRPALKAIARDSVRSGGKKIAKKAGKKTSKTSGKSGSKSTGLTVLVLGGSQGAAQINAMVAAAIPELSAGGSAKAKPGKGSAANTAVRPVGRWMIQCGENNLAQMREQLPEDRFPQVTLFGYHPGIAEFYREADLLIARSGAGVVSEALAFALPMILVPYPFAADNHQLGNAEYLRERGVAHCISQRDTDPRELIEVIRNWSQNPKLEIIGRAQRARDLARPDAAADIREAILADLDSSEPSEANRP